MRGNLAARPSEDVHHGRLSGQGEIDVTHAVAEGVADDRVGHLGQLVKLGDGDIPTLLSSSAVNSGCGMSGGETPPAAVLAHARGPLTCGAFCLVRGCLGSMPPHLSYKPTTCACEGRFVRPQNREMLVQEKINTGRHLHCGVVHCEHWLDRAQLLQGEDMFAPLPQASLDAIELLLAGCRRAGRPAARSGAFSHALAGSSDHAKHAG